MKNVNEHDEIAKRRHHNQYEELRMEILNVSSFIAEKLLK
ncbi:hypothetical protein HMPREF9413_5362 [Paenibacillus sp. HGF7]|nr:hypothetical protein HMPREF9413_5362 [Paenibacillus sp. HGF7]